MWTEPILPASETMNLKERKDCERAIDDRNRRVRISTRNKDSEFENKSLR